MFGHVSLVTPDMPSTMQYYSAQFGLAPLKSTSANVRQANLLASLKDSYSIGVEGFAIEGEWPTGVIEFGEQDMAGYIDYKWVKVLSPSMNWTVPFTNVSAGPMTARKATFDISWATNMVPPGDYKTLADWLLKSSTRCQLRQGEVAC